MKASTQNTLADAYGELGLTPPASEREIKEAYRRLAARWHPDRNDHPRAAERMARINQAYSQLSQPGTSTAGPTRSRQAHPSAAPPRPSPPPPPPPTPPPQAARPRANGQARPTPPEPDADQAAEPAARAPRPWWERDWTGARWEPDGTPKAPSPLRHDASLRLEQAAFGCTHTLVGSVADWCPACTGVGKLVSPRSNCRSCSGEGRTRAGAKGTWRTCAACQGDGTDRKPCDDCQGAGLQQPPRDYHFEVRIPPGLRDGQTMVLRGQGQRGGNAPGDIELGIRVQPHPVFGFDAQQHLSCRVPVDLYSALGENAVEVPMLEGGTMSLDIPAGATRTLDGRGYPNRDGTRGPLVVETVTVMPKGHSAAQRALLRQLAAERRSSGYPHSPELAAWQERLREWRAGSADSAESGG